MHNALLAAFTARTTRVSNPVRSPSFRSSPSEPFWLDAFATGGPHRIIAFDHSPMHTSNFSRSLVCKCPSHDVWLSQTVSQRILQTGYERFRPNNYDHHLWRRCYRGGWHRSYPPLIRQKIYFWQKLMLMHKHLESPYHAFAQCKGFAPAAPLRARARISVPFSEPPLPRLLPITGLVVRYTTNNLIGRRLILRPVV